MARKTINTVKLGVFVMAGLAFLVLILYVIGKNQNLFGKTFVLRARFDNARGLMPGNNIRFAGIDAGTVKEVKLLNDTTIEVTLLLKTKMKTYIHKNATVSIGTDGLMGNRLLSIEPSRTPAPLVEEGDVLFSAQGPDTEEMLKVLNTTNNDISVVAKELRQTVQHLNASKALWKLLDDESLPENIRRSLLKIRSSSENMNNMMSNLDAVVADVKNGKGNIGELLKDTSIASDIKGAVAEIKQAGVKADSLTNQISTLVASVSNEVNNGKGPVNALLKNKGMTQRLGNSLENVERGTQAFDESMQALRHNFLFRSYFKKIDKQKKSSKSAAVRY